MHWNARCDARDVEFVLGTSSTPTSLVTNSGRTSQSAKRHTVNIWLLDFNQCREMTMDEFGVDNAVRAFWDNDPYYPRPHAESEEDQKLWGIFRHSYIESSEVILARKEVISIEMTCLPGRFIEKVIERAKRHLTARAGPPQGSPMGLGILKRTGSVRESGQRGRTL